MRARLWIAAIALAAGGLWSTWTGWPRRGGDDAGLAAQEEASPAGRDALLAHRSPAQTAATYSPAGGAPSARVQVKPPPRAVPTTDAPPPGADDPGPGPWIARYDGRSGRLSPSARPDSADPTTRIESPGNAPTLVVWVPTIRVQSGRDVVLHAALLDEDGAPVAPQSVTASLARHGEQPSMEIPMSAAPPGAAHQFELRLRAPEVDPRTAKDAPAAFDYVVQARGTHHGEPYVRAAAGGFLVHTPGGGIDAASARLERRGSDLALLFDARVDRPGTYWAWAELWGGPDGATPIAFARERFERLGSGLRPLSLVFGGAVIRDAGLDGPFVVRNVRWQQVDAFPPQEQDPIARLAPTPAFHARDFQ